MSKSKRVIVVCQNPKCRKEFSVTPSMKARGKGQYCSRGCAYHKTLAERFWEKVDKNGPTNPLVGTPCWIWKGSTSGGYGTFRGNENETLAHRVSWELEHGPIPSDESVYGTRLILHACDTSLCVRPSHLRMGDHVENMHDRAERKRTHVARGEDNPIAKLTWEQVRAMRAEYVPQKHGIPVLSKKYGVSNATVHRILTNKMWREAM